MFKDIIWPRITIILGDLLFLTVPLVILTAGYLSGGFGKSQYNNLIEVPGKVTEIKPLTGSSIYNTATVEYEYNGKTSTSDYYQFPRNGKGSNPKVSVNDKMKVYLYENGNLALIDYDSTISSYIVYGFLALFILIGLVLSWFSWVQYIYKWITLHAKGAVFVDGEVVDYKGTNYSVNRAKGYKAVLKAKLPTGKEVECISPSFFVRWAMDEQDMLYQKGSKLRVLIDINNPNKYIVILPVLFSSTSFFTAANKLISKFNSK